MLDGQCRCGGVRFQVEEPMEWHHHGLATPKSRQIILGHDLLVTSDTGGWTTALPGCSPAGRRIRTFAKFYAKMAQPSLFLVRRPRAWSRVNVDAGPSAIA